MARLIYTRSTKQKKRAQHTFTFTRRRFKMNTFKQWFPKFKPFFYQCNSYFHLKLYLSTWIVFLLIWCVTHFHVCVCVELWKWMCESRKLIFKIMIRLKKTKHKHSNWSSWLRDILKKKKFIELRWPRTNLMQSWYGLSSFVNFIGGFQICRFVFIDFFLLLIRKRKSNLFNQL